MGLMAEVWSKLRGAGKNAPAVAVDAKNGPNSEIGKRPTPENSTKYLYRMMWVDPDVRQAILDIREMDRLDGRVKRIHARIARDAVKGGLVLTQTRDNPRIRAEWNAFVDRLQLRNPQKLKSDARGLAMEGNLPLQWVLDGSLNVVSGVRMPSETLLPNVGDDGRFKDVTEAYHQIDLMTGGKIATFPLWQLSLCRLDADSFDDQGALGRPFLDASRNVWRKLRMTEEDLVIRRRHRAPLRMAHVLEGATGDELQTYQDRVEAEKGQITTDFYMNRKGGVSAVQGDAALGEIGDVVHLLDTFFSGSPFPKGLMGYTDGMARDILEDLKRDYYEEVDSFQDTLAFAYEFGFRLHLLLKGIVLDPVENVIGFGERKTETPNQLTDRLLKWMALGMPRDMIFEEMGYNAQAIQERLDEQAKRGDPYPGGVDLPGGGMPGGVKITPGNARKGESGTSIGNKVTMSESVKLSFSPDQPREPAGSAEGGQWMSMDKQTDVVQVNLHKKDGYGVDVIVGNDGKIDVYWPGFGVSPGDLRNKVQTAVLEKFRPEMEPGVFWRFTNLKNEPLLAAKGELRKSINHADNTVEAGLSVADGAHYSAQGYKYGYQVSGSVIGVGSDGEPLLDVRSLRPVSKISTVEKISNMDRNKRLELLHKNGWTYDQMKAVVNGRFQIQ